MAAANLSSLVRDKILKHIEDSKHYMRDDMDEKVTAMEITPLLLKKNFTSIQSVEEARELLEEIQKITVNTIKPYNSSEVWKSGVKYISKKDKLLLVAPTFGSLRTFLSYKISRNPALLKNKHIGVETYTNSKGKLSTRSKFDIGHTVGFGKEEHNAVAASRAYKALDFVKDADPDSIATIQNLFLNKFAKAHTKYNLISTKKISLAADIVDGELDFIYTVPQAYNVNQKLGGVEKAILQELKNHILTGKGSKPILDSILEQTAQLFKGQKVSSTNTVTKISGSEKLNIKPTPKLTVKTKKGTTPPLQTTKGRFTSIASLQTLLQPLVTRYVKGNMDSASYFKTDTGNFTKTVQITTIDRAGPTGLNINYEYENSRYGSYEAGRKHHRPGREPSTIISNSIRMAASQLVHNKFKINPIGSL